MQEKENKGSEFSHFVPNRSKCKNCQVGIAAPKSMVFETFGLKWGINGVNPPPLPDYGKKRNKFVFLVGCSKILQDSYRMI